MGDGVTQVAERAHGGDGGVHQGERQVIELTFLGSPRSSQLSSGSVAPECCSHIRTPGGSPPSCLKLVKLGWCHLQN